MRSNVVWLAPPRSFLGLPPYRDSITQLAVHSLYQSLLLHHQQQRQEKHTGTSHLFESCAVEMECRLGQFTPKNQRKQQQQEWILPSSGYEGREVNDRHGLGGGSRAAMRSSISSGFPSVRSSSSNILSSFPVTTPAILHHKAQYQCRFDVGVSSPSLQRLEYLLRIPHRRPPHVIPRGEVPLIGVKTQLLPAAIVVHEDDLSRYQFLIEKQKGERVVRFSSCQTKTLAYQSDVLCPHWSSDMRLSIAVEKIRRLLTTSTSKGGPAASPKPEALDLVSHKTASEWGDSISAMFFQNQRSRSAIGRYFWVDIATVQSLPHSSAFLQCASGSTTSSSSGQSMCTQLYELIQHPSSTCRLDALRGLSLALLNRSRIRKVELEMNIPQLYADWISLARYRHLRATSISSPLSQRTTAKGNKHLALRSSRKNVDWGKTVNQRLPFISRDLYAKELLDACHGGAAGPNICSYPTFFEIDIHRPIEFGGLPGNNNDLTKRLEDMFLYEVAQQMLTLMQFLGAGAQSN